MPGFETSLAEVNTPYWGLRDPVSSVTHFVGLFCAILATRILWKLSHGDRKRQLAVGCFSFSMILQYFASGLYHAVTLPAGQLQVLLNLDLSVIYLLIAGTYTPVFLILLRPRLIKRLLLGAVWAMAAAGIGARWLLPTAPHWLDVTLYVAMGWTAVLMIVELATVLGPRGLFWLISGGVLYTLGSIIDVVRLPALYPGIVGTHEIFHLFVMAGSFCHCVFMARFVIPFEEHAPAKQDRRAAATCQEAQQSA